MTFRIWIDLLLVPLALAAGAVLLGWLADRREAAAGARRAQADQEAQERHLQADREIRLDRSRESVWQTYLDRVAALLGGEWHESGEGFLEANVIRAQTLTALRQLDGERKGLLLQFLYESGLIGRLAPGEIGPPGVVEALVELRGADLNGANLSGADLSHARLRGANLWGANLSDAELDGTNLSGAILSGADFTGARVTGAQLDLAKSLEGTTLPIGAVHD
jgi:uncharacterized protein YjbI with pentapeptide repeats